METNFLRRPNIEEKSEKSVFIGDGSSGMEQVSLWRKSNEIIRAVSETGGLVLEAPTGTGKSSILSILRKSFPNIDGKITVIEPKRSLTENLAKTHEEYMAPLKAVQDADTHILEGIEIDSEGNVFVRLREGGNEVIYDIDIPESEHSNPDGKIEYVESYFSTRDSRLHDELELLTEDRVRVIHRYRKDEEKGSLEVTTPGSIINRIDDLIDGKIKILLADEIHEFHADTELVLAMATVCKELGLIPDLKIGVLSATLDRDKFAEFLRLPPEAIVSLESEVKKIHPQEIFSPINLETAFKDNIKGVPDGEGMIIHCASVREVNELYNDLNAQYLSYLYDIRRYYSAGPRDQEDWDLTSEDLHSALHKSSKLTSDEKTRYAKYLAQEKYNNDLESLSQEQKDEIDSNIPESKKIVIIGTDAIASGVNPSFPIVRAISTGEVYRPKQSERTGVDIISKVGCDKSTLKQIGGRIGRRESKDPDVEYIYTILMDRYKYDKLPNFPQPNLEVVHPTKATLIIADFIEKLRHKIENRSDESGLDLDILSDEQKELLTIEGFPLYSNLSKEERLRQIEALQELNYINSDMTLTPEGRNAINLPVSIEMFESLKKASELGVSEEIFTLAPIWESGERLFNMNNYLSENKRRVVNLLEESGEYISFPVESDAKFFIALTNYLDRQNFSRREVNDFCRSYGLNFNGINNWRTNYNQIRSSYKSISPSPENSLSSEEKMTKVGETLLHFNPEGILYSDGYELQSTVDTGSIKKAHSSIIGQLKQGWYIAGQTNQITTSRGTLNVVNLLHPITPDDIIKANIPGFRYEKDSSFENPYSLDSKGNILVNEKFVYSNDTVNRKYGNRKRLINPDELSSAWVENLNSHPNYQEFHSRNIDSLNKTIEMYRRQANIQKIEQIKAIIESKLYNIYLKRVEDYISQQQEVSLKGFEGLMNIPPENFFLEWSDIDDSNDFDSFEDFFEINSVLYPSEISNQKSMTEDELTASMEYKLSEESYNVSADFVIEELFSTESPSDIVLPNFPQDVINKARELKGHLAAKLKYRFLLSDGTLIYEQEIDLSSDDQSNILSQELKDIIRSKYIELRKRKIDSLHKQAYIDPKDFIKDKDEFLKSKLGEKVKVLPSDIGGDEEYVYPYIYSSGGSYDTYKSYFIAYSDSDFASLKMKEFETEFLFDSNFSEIFDKEFVDEVMQDLDQIKQLSGQSYSISAQTKEFQNIQPYIQNIEYKRSIDKSLMYKNIIDSNQSSVKDLLNQIKNQIKNALKQEIKYYTEYADREREVQRFKNEFLEWIDTEDNSGKSRWDTIIEQAKKDNNLGLLSFESQGLYIANARITLLDGSQIQSKLYISQEVVMDLISEEDNGNEYPDTELEEESAEYIYDEDDFQSINIDFAEWSGQKYSSVQFIENKSQSTDTQASTSQMQQLADLFRKRR
jgi:HrpA-like RNA helicase